MPIICENCGNTYHTVNSCTFPFIELNGKFYDRRVTYNPGKAIKLDFDVDKNEPCFDCGIELGKVHHYGCSAEKCPACDDYLYQCECDGVRLFKDCY